MAQKVYIVEGRQFRTEADYRRALRDKKVIDRLREQIDFQNRSQLSQLVKALQQKKYPFLTLLGQDFMEEAEEALQQLNKSPSGAGKRKGKQAAKKSSGQSPGRKGTAQPPPGGTGQDDQMEKYVQEELRRREKIRKRLALLCSVVAVVCLGYFGIYTYQASRTEREFARLAAYKEKEQDLLVQEVSVSPLIHYTEEGSG